MVRHHCSNARQLPATGRVIPSFPIASISRMLESLAPLQPAWRRASKSFGPGPSLGRICSSIFEGEGGYGNIYRGLSVDNSPHIAEKRNTNTLQLGHWLGISLVVKEPRHLHVSHNLHFHEPFPNYFIRGKHPHQPTSKTCSLSSGSLRSGS